MGRRIIKIILGLISGVILGLILALLTNTFLVNAQITKLNGWYSIFGCGVPGDGKLQQSACSQLFPAVNVPQEAVYWTSSVGGASNRLSGQHNYIMHFPAGQLPPNSAFWSLTMTDAKNQFVANPLNRYSLGSRSNLAENPDGSIDIYIQNASPAGHESNWLPAPVGSFRMWLRVYLPGPSVINNQYPVPAVQEVQ